MGDTDGSSSAAQSAQSNDPQIDSEDTSAKQGGFFSRVIGALTPSEAEGVDEFAKPPVDRLSARGMMNLRSMRVDDVAIPKADIVAVSITITMDELVAVFKESGLTRLPVYDGTLDTPVGMAHLKDLALQYGFNGKPKNFDLQALVRPLLFVPPSMSIGVLLTKMQAERRHMALVIDEYGGVDDGTYWVVEKPGTYLALAKTPLEDFEAEIGHSLTDHDTVDEEEIDTLGGLVFMLSGRVPARGEVVLHPDGPEFEVIDADPRRIKRLRVRTTGANG